MGRGHGGSRGGGAGGRKGLEKALKTAEDSIRGQSVENAFVFDKNGNEVFRNVASSKSSTSNDPYSRLTQNSNHVEVPVEYLKDNIITHNHPLGDSFSTGDLRMAFKGDASEIRAVGKMTYSLKRPKGGWNVYPGTVVEYYRKIHSSGKSQHETMKMVASRFGFDYTWTESQ